ncbi:MAG: phosphonate C-P lyase system protein PhnG [Rhodospirillales bacterium]
MTETPKANTPVASDPTRARAEWMGILARAPEPQLEAAWNDLSADRGDMAYSLLRAPEKGLVMVRGRAGGDGKAFNLGEMTVTRCSVKLADGTVGHGYVAGRSARHAELIAVFDGLLQIPAYADAVVERVLAPVKASLAVTRAQTAAKTAATKVEFFTMVREQGASQE